MLLFHILYQCLFKDNQGLFCERSIYIHILILVPFVLYSNSVDLLSSHSISKLHFIQCHKFYIYIYTHTHTPVSYYCLHHTTPHYWYTQHVYINKIFLQTLCQKLPSLQGRMLRLTVSFYMTSCTVYKQMVQNRHQVLCLSYHPFHNTFTSKLWITDKPDKLRSKFLRWSTLNC